ncbi:hypothetical protein [Chryseobacterium sp. WLY505]|uniref:hypothetical protein n=1 Tax=Chryseobacterium sp. WLY505 TaxID=3068892 RepID=UPI002796A7C9|nr:hypothetical protein [Chryseobacterium sp. WLY505]MDQ1859221.1 hypothetical protein [Chryseobacterium sp. WLY505]
MKKRYVPIVMLLAFQFCHGQSLPQPNNNYGLPKIVVPSQETFANSRLNFEPSSTGDFSYQFSIYEGIKTPVNLNYTSGIRVDDIGTSTGMSWQLNTGGAISRIVKDETDENRTNWKPSTVNEATDLQNIKDAARAGNAIDTEYDWFNFSISNGLSGSFYIDSNLNAYIESKDKIKIQIFDKNTPVTGYGKLLEFKLTDKIGNEYYFGGSEINIEKTTYQNAGPDQHAITGWYLYKIVSPEKKETLFNYITEDVVYYSSLSASFNVQQNCSPPASSSPYTYSDIIKTKSILQSYKPRLNTISEDDTEIKFVYNKERKDIFNSNAQNNLLTSIEIKSNNRLIDSYTFEYFDTLNTPAAAYYGLPGDERSTTNRHFLKSVNRVSRNAKTEFEYYNLSSLPARFSLSSDYYGYPNGVGNSSPFPAIANDNNFGIFQGLSSYMPLSMLSADKKVNPLLASMGNLKKITHPTKGISEIFYEPNASMGQVNQEVKESRFLSANFNKCNLANDAPLDSFTFVSNGNIIEFYGEAFFDDYYGCNEPDTQHDIHQLKITDLTTGNTIFSDANKVSEPFQAKEGTNHLPLTTISGHMYKVEYSVSSLVGAVSGWLNITYNKHTVSVNQPIYFGGSRIASFKETNTEGDNYTKKFYYNSLANISNQNSSITDYNTTYVMAQKQETSKSCQNSSGTFPQVEILDVYNAYQNSILPFFNHRKNSVFYSTVTEIIEGKSAVERKFSYEENLDPYIGRPPAIYYMPTTNLGELKSNLLLEENIYKFENNNYSKIINKTYKYDYSQEKNLRSYVFRENFAYSPDPAQDQLLNISYGFYENYYGFYNPTEIKTTEYFPNNVTLVTTNTNSYSNPNHYQLTSSKTEHPDHSISEAIYSYAHEKSNQLMISKNMIGIPLEIVSSKTVGIINKTLSKTNTLYPASQSEADLKTSSLILPYAILSTDLQNVVSTEVTYDKYDSKGNLQQYTTKDGLSTVIIWGYNQTQPIAKIEGAKLSDISQSLMDSIVTASNTDALAAPNNDETTFLSALNTFRSNSALSGYQITTYTYDPLVGVRSITPPSGIRENYVYDSANRLQKVIDVNGKVLKEMKYNYKN